MSILSSAKNLVKKVAKKTYETVNKIGSSIANLGSSNLASAGMSFPVGENLTKTQTQKAYDVISKGGSGSNIPTGAQIAPKYSSTPYGPTLPVTINAGQQNIPNAQQDIKKMNGLSAQLGSSGASSARTINTGSLTGSPGAQNTGTLLSSPSSYNPGNIDNTNLVGPLSDTMSYDATSNQFIANPTQQSDQQIIEKKKKLYDSVFGQRPDVYEDPQVRRAMRERNILQEQLTAQTSELNAIVAKQTQDILQLGKTASDEGTVEAVYGRQVDAVNYNAAIRALPIQASIATLKGQLDVAQDNLNELTRIKTEQINTQYEYNKNLLNSIEGSIDQKDKEIYDQLKTQNERAYNDHRDLIKFQEDISKEIIKNSGNISSELLSNKLKRINQAQTRADVMKEASDILGSQFVAGGTTDTTISNDPFIQKLAQSAGGKPITDTFAQQLNKGLTVLGQIGALQTNVQGIKTGPIIGAFKGANPWDTNAQTIKAQLNAIVPNLARGVYGEVGVLTDNDIKQYSKTLPNLTSTEDVRNAVLGITVDIIGKSIKRVLEINAANGKDVSGFIDIYSEMKNTRDSIFQQIPGYKGDQTSGSNQSVDYTATLDSIFK